MTTLEIPSFAAVIPHLIYADDKEMILNYDAMELRNICPPMVQPDIIITSPPYNLDMDYGVEGGDAKTVERYVEWCRDWLRVLNIISSDRARLFLNIPLDVNKPEKSPIYALLSQAAMSIGWKYHTTIVWNEENISRRTAWGSWCRPSAPFITAPVEMIVVLYKEEWKRPPEGRTWDTDPDEFLDWSLGLWTFPGENPKRVGHPAPFPGELPYRIIKTFSYKEDIIFDPFLGSGTTLAVAKLLGRNGWGTDTNKEYCVKAGVRIAKVSGERR